MPVYYYNTNIGTLGIAEANQNITAVYFADRFRPDEADIRETVLIKEAYSQLDAYLSGRLREFSLPLSPQGTSFMLRVWSELQKIPYGQTVSYGQIAGLIGNKKACRAVGMANNRNPIPIIIPCHRVIGANGKLVGFGGGLDLKQKLLDLERSVLDKHIKDKAEN